MDYIALIGGIFFLGLFLSLSLFIYKKENDGKRYSFLKMFPFELKGKNVSNVIPLILLSVSLCFLCFISLNNLYFKNVNFICRVFSCTLILSAIMALGLFVIDTASYKSHIWISSIFYTLTFISYMLFGFWGLRAPFDNYPLWSIILSFAIGFLVLISMFIPLLENWYKLKKNNDSSSKEEYTRGKVFILAFIEWIDVILFYGLFILLIIVSI